MRHRITFLPQRRTTSAPDGTTVFRAAQWAGLAIESTCGGHGTCGQCKVRMREGAGPADEADRQFLSSTELEEGWRLACRAAVHSDCVVETPRLMVAVQAALLGSGRTVALDPNVRKVALRLVEPSLEDARPDLTRVVDALSNVGYQVRAAPAVWRELPGLLRGCSFSCTAVLSGNELIAVEPGDTSQRGFGLALDIGTTTVSGALVNLESGAVEATESVLNGQASCGADVIARISHAAFHEGGLADLQARVAGTVNKLVETLAAGSGVAPQEIYEAVAVGNATMLHLLLGIDAAPIGVSPFIPAFGGAMTLPAADAGLRLHPQARLSTLPLAGAYVGADIVAGLLATDALRRDDGKPRLYLDIGTNSEIVLGCGERWLAAAAPAGPAFEGAQIRCGMRAAAGTVERVEIAEDVRLGIVGGEPRPLGICGSGLIDAVAEMLRCGILEPSGRFAQAPLPDSLAKRLTPGEGFLLSAPEDAIILTQADIRALQLAKAAIAAGVELLMERLRVRAEDLEEVLLAGSFGTYLHPASARGIGLVPAVPMERIRAVGNVALEGAKIALVSRGEREAAERIVASLEYVELSGHPRFAECFSKATAFQAT